MSPIEFAHSTGEGHAAFSMVLDTDVRRGSSVAATASGYVYDRRGVPAFGGPPSSPPARVEPRYRDDHRKPRVGRINSIQHPAPRAQVGFIEGGPS
jgi:hypothetical protein